MTEDTLSKLTVTQLKRSLEDIYTAEEEQERAPEEIDKKGVVDSDVAGLKDAVRILWGEETEESDDSLKIQPYQAGDMPSSLRIAVASNTAEQLDGHFGSCHRYLIYQLSVYEMRLVDVRSTLEADLSDDKNASRIDLIRDCSLLYIVSIGGPAAAKVIQANIYPMKEAKGGDIREILAKLQRAIATSPPPWLAKLLGVGVDKRVKNYNAVG